MRIGEVWKRHAIRFGVIAAVAALLLWPAHAAFHSALRLPFIAALLLTAAAGVSLVAITASDILTVRRSRHARPARLFDLALGALLALPASLALQDLIG